MKREKVIEVLGLYLMLENISQRRVELIVEAIADELLADEPATGKSYPEEFDEWCIENIDEEEREEVGYYYSYFNRGNVIGFDTIKDVYDFWQGLSLYSCY